MRMAKQLRHRLEILKPKDLPNDQGGLDRSYEKITEIWGGIKAVSDYIKSIRGTIDQKDNTAMQETHKFLVRSSAIEYFGSGFGKGFDKGYKSGADINPMKSEYFIGMKLTENQKRLFRVLGFVRAEDDPKLAKEEDRKEYYLISVKEIEEQGTGYQ